MRGEINHTLWHMVANVTRRICVSRLDALAKLVVTNVSCEIYSIFLHINAHQILGKKERNIERQKVRRKQTKGKERKEK